MNTLFDSFLHLIYPHLCLHCEDNLPDSQKIFCESCFHLLELIDIKLHCPICFSANFCTNKKKCADCFLKSNVLKKVGSTFYYKGPAITLIKKFKYGNMPYLAEGIAGFMAAQLLHLNFPIPDLIIPVPQSLSRWLTRKYNQAELLANSLSKILNVPVQNSLKRKSGDYSQAALKKEARIKLNQNHFILRKNQNLESKTILLVDDVLTTGATLKASAEALQEEFPASVYALTACHAS